MKEVGKLYESKEYYIADLIMAGLIFKEVLKLDVMKESLNNSSNVKMGKIVIGTVKGDIHDQMYVYILVPIILLQMLQLE